MMMRSQAVSKCDYDVIVVGGGHNGLVCAFYLGQAGLRVAVLEKNSIIGGAAVTEEFWPGFRNSVASYTVGLLNEKIISDMALRERGLEIVERPIANFWPMQDGPGLVFSHNQEQRRDAIAFFSQRDAENLDAYDGALHLAAEFMRSLVLTTPPNAGSGVWEIIKLRDPIWRMMRSDMVAKRTLTDMFTRSAADFLDQWFESDIVKGAFAFDGIVGAYAAPSTPGTAYVLLHHCFGAVNGKSGVWGHAIGGMGAITQAMARAAADNGVEICTRALVDRIDVMDRNRIAVRLSAGTILTARAVAACVPPKLLFRDLIPSTALPGSVRQRFLSIKSGSATFRMNVALSELPNFSSRPGRNQQDHHGSGIIIGPGIDYLERAYIDAKRDGWSREPVIEMLIPSTLDPTLAPHGGHVASLFVQHVAPKLPMPRSWLDPTEKEKFADHVIGIVSRYAPNFGSAVLGREVLSPLDLERRFGLIDGDIFHGQLGLGQMFSLRPVLGHADYRLPMHGLYLCGSGSHPGGGVTGAPGHNAAREILHDLRSAHLW